MRIFNRLWVRISLSIIVIVSAITILPYASLLFAETDDFFRENEADIEQLNQNAGLNLSAEQIEVLAGELTGAVWAEYISDIQYLGVTTLIVGVLAGLLLGRWLSRPIERLAKATRAVASQELSHRVEVKGAQEITDLADDFNQMTVSLERSETLRRNMMADVSHELLTPLTVLQGNLRAILDDVYELNKDEIAKLYVQNKHLIGLVRDLRQLSQAEAGQLPLNMVPVDLSALADETVSIFLPLAQEKEVIITSRLTESLPPVQGDPDRLRQVLHNLLANALRHTPPGGQITVRSERSNDEIRLSFTDSGEGIDPELQRVIFERFYRANEGQRRDSGGAGLGLAISKAIVEAHKGRLEASSPGVNQGSTFSIYLPVL